MKKMMAVSLLFILVLSMIAGCAAKTGSGSDTNDKKEATQATNEDKGKDKAEPMEADNSKAKPAEQVTIKFLWPWDAETFERRYRPIEKMLPNIKIEMVQGGLEDLHAKNIIPDIILTAWAPNPYERESSEPLDGLIEKHHFDLGAMNPELIASERAYDKDGRLMSLPNSNDVVVMYYNKEVFDKFGLHYPTDNMTWDEVIEAAKQMTKERDGVKYRGLEIRPDINFGLQQLGVNLTDPETGDVTLAKDPSVIRYFELLKKIYSTPGMVPSEAEADPFPPFVEGRVAMMIHSAQFMRWGVPNQEVAGRLDFAAAPVWPDKPDTTLVGRSYAHNLINKYSEHKDEAFQVLAAYYSPEIQTRLTRGAEEVTPLTDPGIQAQFGADHPNYQGKNVKAIFAHKAAKPPQVISSWDTYVNLDQAAFMKSEMNIPEFLRVKTEEAEIKIKDAKGQK